MSKPAWRIYYDNGTTKDDRACTPQHAPGRGVQTIVQWVNGNRQILHGFALYYWMRDLECWWGGDLMGYLELTEGDDRACFPKRGLNCRDFQAILDATVTDPDFDPGERDDA